MTNSSKISDWTPSLSFCFITNGAKPEKLRLAIQSVRALQIPNYEIIISGKPPRNFAAPDTKFVELASAADNGQLGAMRNAACRIANYEILVVADDDILFQEDFYEGICAYGPNFDVAGCRILNTDESRYWDYAVINSPTGHHLIPYSQKSPHTYITGGLIIMRQHFFKAIEWNEERGFYKEEDVEFSKRIRDAGYNISFNTFSSVIHNDDSYYRIEDRVETRKIPACWQEVAPGVYAQGIFRKIKDFFLTARIFKFEFAQIISSKKLIFSLSSFPMTDSYLTSAGTNSFRISVDGNEVGNGPLGVDVINLVIAIGPGQRNVVFEIDSPSIPAIVGIADSSYYGGIITNFRLESEISTDNSLDFKLPNNQWGSRSRIIAPILDTSEIGLALRETILLTEKSGTRFSIEATRSNSVVTAGSESDFHRRMVMFEPDLQLENQAYVFHDGQFELSANFYKPSSKRWGKATFIGPASAVDDYLARSVEEGNISIGVPSTEDREKLIACGISPGSVFYIPFLPNPAVTKVRDSKKIAAGAKVFINLNWGGPKDLSRLIEGLPKQYNGQIHYRIWIGNENIEEIVRRHFINNGFNLAEVTIVCGGMPDEHLRLFIGETDLAICWNAEDEIGYFVRRLICSGIPVIGNLVGARRDIESGFVEVREISEIASSMVQVLDSWNQYHQAALDYRQRLSESPIFGDRLNSLKLIQEELRNKTITEKFSSSLHVVGTR